MRIKYLITIILFLAGLTLTQRVFAQMPSADQIQAVNIDQLSDNQVTLIWQRLQEFGLSDSETFKELQKRGMSAGQVQALKDRVTLLGLNSKSSSSTNDRRTNLNQSSTRIDYSRRRQDTVIIPNSRRSNTSLSQQRNNTRDNSRT